jgi:hypothetical protein
MIRSWTDDSGRDSAFCVLFTTQPKALAEASTADSLAPVVQKMANWTPPCCSLAPAFFGSCEESHSSMIAKHWGRGPG